MSKWKISAIYLVLIFLAVVIGLSLTFIRGDLGVFDVKLTAGLTAFTLITIAKNLWWLLLLVVFAGFLIKTPLWVGVLSAIATVITLFVHQILAPFLGQSTVIQLGVLDSFLMYFPTVALVSLLGGLAGNLWPRRSHL